MLYNWRISKYNPIFRDDNDRYTLEGWTSFDDIGKCFNGKEFTNTEYLSIENSYIKVAVSALKAAALKSIRVTELEKLEYTLDEKTADAFGMKKLYDSIKNDV